MYFIFVHHLSLGCLLSSQACLASSALFFPLKNLSLPCFSSKLPSPNSLFFSQKNAPCFSSKLLLALAEKPHFFILTPARFSSQNVPCFSSRSSFSHSLLNEAPLDHRSLGSSPDFLLPYFSLKLSKPPLAENLYPLPLFFSQSPISNCCPFSCLANF